MKKIIARAALLALACVFAAPCFCGEWTEHEKSLFDESLQIRLESRKIDGLRAALDWIEKKQEEFFSSILNDGSVSQEALLALENNFAIERYHFLWEIDDKSKPIQKSCRVERRSPRKRAQSALLLERL